jgi:hypothetical protein
MRRNARDALQKKIEIERIREFIEEEEEEEEEDDYNEGEEYGCDEEYYDPILNPNFKGDLGGRIDTRSFQRLATTQNSNSCYAPRPMRVWSIRIIKSFEGNKVLEDRNVFEIEEVDDVAKRYGYASIVIKGPLIDAREKEERVIYRKSTDEGDLVTRIEVFMKSGIVCTSLIHPKSGLTDLYRDFEVPETIKRREMNYRELEKIFADPRIHTGRGTYDKKKWMKGSAYESMNPIFAPSLKTALNLEIAGKKILGTSNLGTTYDDGSRHFIDLNFLLSLPKRKHDYTGHVLQEDLVEAEPPCERVRNTWHDESKVVGMLSKPFYIKIRNEIGECKWELEKVLVVNNLPVPIHVAMKNIHLNMGPVTNSIIIDNLTGIGSLVEGTDSINLAKKILMTEAGYYIDNKEETDPVHRRYFEAKYDALASQKINKLSYERHPFWFAKEKDQYIERQTRKTTRVVDDYLEARLNMNNKYPTPPLSPTTTTQIEKRLQRVNIGTSEAPAVAANDWYEDDGFVAVRGRSNKKKGNGYTGSTGSNTRG